MTSRFRAFFVAVSFLFSGLIASSAWAGAGGAPVTLGDFNADGRIDVLVADDGVLYVYATAEGGTTVNATESATIALPPEGTIVRAVADFNGDGRADVLVETETQNLYTYIMDDTAPGTPIAVDSDLSGSPIAVPTGFAVAGAGDANADNRADIYLVDGSGLLYTYIVEAGGISVDPGASGSPVTIPAGWSIDSIGDYNGDGFSDVLVRQEGTGTLYTWATGPGGITFESSRSGSPFALPANWTWGGGGKFVSDKISSDLAIQNNTDGLVYTVVTQNSGVDPDYDASGLNVGGIGDFTVAGIGDFDGDSVADTLVQNIDGLLYVFINTGPTAQSAQGLITTVPGAFAIATGKVGF
ncbi:VCBS repeat-containing protein [Myxococcota bacterium]|nr:VCBS repeat-containing protein [Myxococcota bacterium]